MNEYEYFWWNKYNSELEWDIQLNHVKEFWRWVEEHIEEYLWNNEIFKDKEFNSIFE